MAVSLICKHLRFYFRGNMALLTESSEAGAGPRGPARIVMQKILIFSRDVSGRRRPPPIHQSINPSLDVPAGSGFALAQGAQRTHHLAQRYAAVIRRDTLVPVRTEALCSQALNCAFGQIPVLKTTA